MNRRITALALAGVFALGLTACSAPGANGGSGDDTAFGTQSVADACATRPLQTSVAAVSAAQLQHSALATIADLYGVVVPSSKQLC